MCSLLQVRSRNGVKDCFRLTLFFFFFSLPATDYDAWRETSDVVDVTEVLQSLNANVQASNVVTKALVDKISALVSDDDSEYFSKMNGSMKNNIMTKPEHLPTHVKDRLRYLLPWYPN